MEYTPAKHIVYRDKGYDWFGTEYKMNIYRGCCHGCIYCDSRSDCYQIDRFDTVRAKENALAIIRDDLRRKVKPGVVMTGATSDPYNPFEEELQLSRHALELISAYGFGVGIATKSPLIVRDIDILLDIMEHSPVIAKLTITTVDDDLGKRLEPYAPPVSQRFAALNQLTDKGIFAGVLLMPVLPWITDSPEQILALVERARECGARFIYPWFGLSMRSGQREHLYAQFDERFPGMREKYTAAFGERYNCPSPRAKKLYGLFCAACDAAGILYRMDDIIKSYRMGYEGTQLTFF
ncbi:radical SAM protein [Ruminococcaceae bacterium OttesenSCG-928-L11]|nr:radical SAM protein [Ruminococcaceae bacterium OttesenSCG-928-L11]